MNTPNLPTSIPSIEMLRSLKEQGLVDQVKAIEQMLGLNIDALEKPLEKFITQDPTCFKLKAAVRNLSVEKDTVLVNGETGTGKELIANALHGMRSGAFVAVNCAGMPDTLIESELFGHAAGSFTGAKGDTEGLISLANNGTLFLDEIGDFPLHLQAKLLRVLEQKTLRKVGGKKEEPVTARFVAATHKNIEKAVSDGEFREDLYARISTFELSIPPLRERYKDCDLIVNSLFGDIKLPWKWEGMSLKRNVRDLIKYVRRYKVIGEVPVNKIT